MTIGAVLLAILTGIMANECCDLAPWCARKLVRWSAFRRYTDPDRAEERAEELAAVINDRPGNLFKLITALTFVGGAVLVSTRRSLGRQAGTSQTTKVPTSVLLALAQARRHARKAIPVTATLPLSEAIRQADEANARAVVVVDHENTPIAIVNESAVKATPPQRRQRIETVKLARMLDPGLVLPADLCGIALLEAVRKSPASEYLVVEPTGQVCGVLAASDLDGAIAGIRPGRH